MMTTGKAMNVAVAIIVIAISILPNFSYASPCRLMPCHKGRCIKTSAFSAVCRCNTGYRGYKCHIDVNECKKDPCHPDAVCSNTRGSYTCTCRSGFEGNGRTCTGKV
ncbi:fibropellin-1-like [Haliotis rubra]|uniref:fibropellin-1-like n=1 Tax=Haliotis rubra TaxID=36100 RepID=UPI001EE5F522|nr:fibropellin-1-like [Haliotis rubra]